MAVILKDKVKLVAASPCLFPAQPWGFLLLSSDRTQIIFCLHLFPLPLSLHFDWLLHAAQKRDEKREKKGTGEREKECGEDERIRSAIVQLQINFALAGFPWEKR